MPSGFTHSIRKVVCLKCHRHQTPGFLLSKYMGMRHLFICTVDASPCSFSLSWGNGCLVRNGFCCQFNPSFCCFWFIGFFLFFDPIGRPRFLGAAFFIASASLANVALFFAPLGRPRFLGSKRSFSPYLDEVT